MSDSSEDREYRRVKGDERRWQDRLGGDLQKSSYQRAGTQLVIHRQFGRVQDALTLEKNVRLLDIGCGVGHFLDWLAHRLAGEYHGMDLSLASATRARIGNPSLKITCGDAETLPYGTGSFDRISCNGAAHHLPNLRTAVGEMYRVLTPGGILVMYEPSATWLTNAVRRVLVRDARYESPVDLAHKNEFTRNTVSAVLKEAGFCGVAISSHDVLAYPLTGMYMDLAPGRSRSVMHFITRVEAQLERWPLFEGVFRLFAWRWLIVARKPHHHA